MEALDDLLREEIRAQGPLPFDRFMEVCLYHPEHGYYTRGPRRAGQEWTTGPTHHPLFGRTLARGLAPLLAQVEEPCLVEVGAGSGELARDICRGLRELDAELLGEVEVVVVDRSPANLERAREALEDLAPALGGLTLQPAAPDRFAGVLLSNELLDALPVHLVEAGPGGRALERRVALDGDTLAFKAGTPSQARVASLGGQLLEDQPAGTRAEVPLAAVDWVLDHAARLEKGAMVTIDYGAPAAALRQRLPQGTVHGYHRGQLTTDLLAHPGEQDLTYLVPFDLVQAAGRQAGLADGLYAPQGLVLEELGMPQLAHGLPVEQILKAKRLISAGEAGGSFKVLVQTRGVELDAPWPLGLERVQGGVGPLPQALEAARG